MPAETSINAEPAAHIPNCRRDRCEKMDLSSAADGDGGADGWFPADAILCYAWRCYLALTGVAVRRMLYLFANTGKAG
jgi:hypothetical protein